MKLQAQPAKVLGLLLHHSGAIVSRDTLKHEVWGESTHVDFDRGLNFCIAQIRSALRDTAASSAYIETVPKQGYRFIAAVERPEDVPVPEAMEQLDGRATASESPAWSRRGAAGLVAVSLLVAALIGLVKASSFPPVVVVIPFYNETPPSCWQPAPIRRSFPRPCSDSSVEVRARRSV